MVIYRKNKNDAFFKNNMMSEKVAVISGAAEDYGRDVLNETVKFEGSVVLRPYTDKVIILKNVADYQKYNNSDTDFRFMFKVEKCFFEKLLDKNNLEEWLITHTYPNESRDFCREQITTWFRPNTIRNYETFDFENYYYYVRTR